jgi:hypothetical protein
MDLRLTRIRLTGADGKPRSTTTTRCWTGTRSAASCLCSGPAASGGWLWTFTVFPNSAADRGDAETLNEPKAAFRRRVETVGPFDLMTMRLIS